MSLFANIKSKIRTFDFDKVIIDYVEANQEEITKLQTSQWDEGKANTGRKLKNKVTGKTKYSDAYKRRKKRIGLQTSVVNLSLSGDFRKGTGVLISGRKIIFTSLDDKTGLVTYQYSDEVFGLTDKNFRILQDGIKQELSTKLIKDLK
jgi:hypothetical protein